MEGNRRRAEGFMDASAYRTDARKEPVFRKGAPGSRGPLRLRMWPPRTLPRKTQSMQSASIFCAKVTGGECFGVVRGPRGRLPVPR